MCNHYSIINFSVIHKKQFTNTVGFFFRVLPTCTFMAIHVVSTNNNREVNINKFTKKAMRYASTHKVECGHAAVAVSDDGDMFGRRFAHKFRPHTHQVLFRTAVELANKKQ